MQVGSQYYRPPFPNQQYWEEDFRAMAEAGLNTVQLWVLWSRAEAKPGEFRFDDYDRLVALADRNGLSVVLSVVAEVHPLWIHRLIPGSEMINDLGHKVVSTNRKECHFGLSPGACTDHPDVWRRMSVFLRKVVERYREAPSLFGWDAWNESRRRSRVQARTPFRWMLLPGTGWPTASALSLSSATRRPLPCV
jgi:beta-galactosidase